MRIEAALLPRGTEFKTGARPTPRHKLLAAPPFRVVKEAPAQFALIPKKLDYWANNQYGDCVSAEEAFAKACDNPEDFIPSDEVVRWARAGGFLNGADLAEVMDAMIRKGFVVGENTYNDGKYAGVDYSKPDVIRAAICTGPVKIAIDSSALPRGAGNQQGWYATGGRQGQYRNTDHCVGLCGSGPAKWLFEQLGVPLPAALKPDQQGFLLFTWSTIGFVDHDWIMSTTTEAWVRNPTTVIVGPEPQPMPPNPEPTPTPPPPQPPAPSPWKALVDFLIQHAPEILAVLISLLKHAQQAADEARHKRQRGQEGGQTGS